MEAPVAMLYKVLKCTLREDTGQELRACLHSAWQMPGLARMYAQAAFSHTVVSMADLENTGAVAGLGIGNNLLERLKQAEQTLPYFVRTSLVMHPGIRAWQRRFVVEAEQAWFPDLCPPWTAVQHVPSDLLQVAATGAGKTLAIAMAPFCGGARERCLIVVPDEVTLRALAIDLNHTNGRTNIFRQYGVLVKGAKLPRCLVLDDQKAELMLDQIVQHEVVLTTVQHLVSGVELDSMANLFDLLIFDEAHRLCASWQLLRHQLTTTRTVNVLLFTATPFTHGGDLGLMVHRSLSKFSLLDACENRDSVGCPYSKKVVFLEIDHSDSLQANFEILHLVGDMMVSKMMRLPHFGHAGMITVQTPADAKALQLLYDNQPDETKPRVSRVDAVTHTLVVKAVYGPEEGMPADVAADILTNFKLGRYAPDPVDIVVMCQTLVEGFNLPRVSVLGICMRITHLSEFAQFVGRSVRRLGPGVVDRAMLKYVQHARDNVAHVVSHATHGQIEKHWAAFAKQEAPTKQKAPTKQEAPTKQPLKKAKIERSVSRWALASTSKLERELVANEINLHDNHVQMWNVQNRFLPESHYPTP
jgi:superfamily II DNA or RNA helicase